MFLFRISILGFRIYENKHYLRHGRKTGDWKKQSDGGQFSEDEFFRREKLLQELVDKKIAEVESLGKAKEEELVQI